MRRRRAMLVLGLSFVLYTAFGFLAVPRIVETQLAKRARQSLGREATVAGVRFNPFTLVLTVEGFRLADRDGAALVTFERLLVNFDTFGVFRRAWRFREIALDRPVVAARILEDGRSSVADLLGAEPGEPPAEPFRMPRLIVDRLAVAGGSIEFTDRSLEPAFEWRFEPLDVDVHDLITIPEQSGEHSITIGLASGAEVSWTGSQTVEPLRFSGRFDVTGLQLPNAWEYFGRRQPVDVRNGRVDVVLPYELTRPAEGGFELSVAGAAVKVSQLVVGPRDGDEEWLVVPEIDVRDIGVRYPERRVEIGGVRVAGARVLLRREEQGEINWAVVAQTASSTDDSATAEAEPAAPWGVRVARVEVEGASAHVVDRVVEPDLALDVTEIGLRLDGVSSDLAAPVPFRAGARVGETGKLEASGTVAPDPLVAEADLDLSGLELVILHPYLQMLPKARVVSGTTAAKGKLEYKGDPLKLRYTGTASADGIALDGAQGERVLSWERMAIDGIDLELPPATGRIKTVTIHEAFAMVYIDKERNLNLAQLRPDASPEAETASGEPPPRVEIGSVQIVDAAIDFTDESLFLPFGTKIHGASGAIRDLSTFAAAPATVGLEGRVDEKGAVKIEGVVRLADPFASTDLKLAFRHIEMNRLTPYSAEFAGYAISSGVLDVDVGYRVTDRFLDGDHRVVASDLVLGDKVEGASSAGLPARLAVALLKDKNGRIDLDVPIEGHVDSPEFAYRKVFWQAFKKILTNVATAPFRALGRLFGNDQDDLDLVEFDAGRTDLLPAELDTLTKLAAELGPRTELTIGVAGRFDPVSDAQALRKARLEAAIEARREAVAAEAAATGASTLETILEALYAERFSAEALEVERRKFLPVPAPPPEPGAQGKSTRKQREPTPTPASASQGFDAAGFYESLRARLLESETVTDAELADLARARSATIRDTLCGAASLDASRVRLLDPAPVKRKKAGSDRIASEMAMDAKDGGRFPDPPNGDSNDSPGGT